MFAVLTPTQRNGADPRSSSFKTRKGECLGALCPGRHSTSFKAKQEMAQSCIQVCAGSVWKSDVVRRMLLLFIV